MDENMKENSVKNTGINVDQDSLQNLASNFLKNQNSLDLGSLMQMATTLLKNDSLMNSVTELSKKKQNSKLPDTKITEKLEKVTNDNSVQNTGNNVDKDPVNHLIKNENSLDLNSMMQLASTLMKNESLLNSVTELSEKNINATLPVSKVSKKQRNVELTSLSEKMENIANDISGLRQENAELASLSQKLENITNDISGLRQENAELASLSQKLENITNDISGLRKENAELASLSQKLENITNDISGLRQENAELASLSQKLENITNDILEFKKELKDVKEQNSELNKLLKKILKNNKK
ncbi:hypothetical protein KW850_04660 [Bacillus sp. sid0103]|uniref:hypothetical protein n=1 Tax=Bacillus sp. sid0103 TaxID=2856337 RepID=UPI001C46F392|nr:hypothetical protein [Bacillus sp. sid0103]MBV7504558.1 hypothetical protein [Bacillus sp. sid0103]